MSPKATDQLPVDLVEFLDAGGALQYRPNQCECGAVELYRSDQVPLVEFRVHSYDSPWSEVDPHSEDDGAYMVPAYDLIARCEGYRPRGILIYVPSLGVYGCHDDDHKNLRVFDDATIWEDIVLSPTAYLNEQWYGGFGELLNPVGTFDFREAPG